MGRDVNLKSRTEKNHENLVQTRAPKPIARSRKSPKPKTRTGYDLEHKFRSETHMDPKIDPKTTWMPPR